MKELNVLQMEEINGGGFWESVACGLAFDQLGIWNGIAFGLAGVSLGVSIGIAAAISIMGTLGCAYMTSS